MRYYRKKRGRKKTLYKPFDGGYCGRCARSQIKLIQNEFVLWCYDMRHGKRRDAVSYREFVKHLPAAAGDQ